MDYISSAGWGIFISEIKGIKENNGDLKLARMIPEVYEVFELLEFHYILKAYDTLDEAVEAFVKESGLTGALSKPKDATQQIAAPSPVTKPVSQPKSMARVEEVDHDEEDEMPAKHDDDDLTPDEYLKKAAKANPMLTAWQLKKLLSTSDYGYTKMGWFEIRGKLKNIKR